MVFRLVFNILAAINNPLVSPTRPAPRNLEQFLLNLKEGGPQPR